MLNQVKEKGYLAMNFLKEISFHNRCACLNKGDLSFSAKYAKQVGEDVLQRVILIFS